MSQNPYASPQTIPVDPDVRVVPVKRARPVRAFGRWTLICCISAAPSFFWGCALHSGTEYVLGMAAGILVFVVAYTVAECTHYYQQIVTRPHVHRTVLIGYGTRILVSVIFPVGLAIDMVVGAISTSIVQNVSPTASTDLATAGDSATVFSVFLTTVVQGVLLNVVLMAYMLVVYALLIVVARVRERMRQRKHVLAVEQPLS